MLLLITLFWIIWLIDMWAIVIHLPNYQNCLILTKLWKLVDPCFVETNEENAFIFLIDHIQVIFNIGYLRLYVLWMKNNWVRYILLKNISYMHKNYYVQSCINEKQYCVVKMAGKSVFQLFSLYALDTTLYRKKLHIAAYSMSV